MDWERLQAWFDAQKIAADTFSGLVLGAHAYAAAVTAFEEARPARNPGAVAHLGSLRAAVAGVTRARSVDERYEALLAVLLACETDLADPARRAGMPALSPLDPGSGLTGLVHHAWRGRGVWRARRHRRREDLGAGPTSYALRPEDQLDHLWFAFRRSEPLAYVPLAARGLASRRVVTALGDRLDAGSLRVALCPLTGSTGPRFRVTGDRFVACPEHAPVGAERLATVLAAAAEEQIGLLLLPELHVRPEELVGIESAGAVLTVAGSFHVQDGGVRNRAPVLVDGGHRLWEHDKRGYFRVRRADAERPPFEPASGIAEEVYEGIVGGGALTVLDTSLGRLAAVICADALEPTGYVRAIEDARPDFVLVVSYSPETHGFERRAEEWERLGISTLYVNAASGRALRGMCWLAVRGSAAHPPTRIRWADGGLEVWRPRVGWNADTDGVAWLHPELGLVVDLARVVRDGESAPGLPN
jgi:predicted amidohydrolase